MALPLLGILGLGAAAAIEPHWQNYRADIAQRGRQRRIGGLLDGIDVNDTQAVNNALFRGGLLDPEQFFGTQLRDREQQSLDWSRRQSAALGWSNYGLQRDQFNESVYRWSTEQNEGGLPMFGGSMFDIAFGALVGMESGGNPNAVSPKGAMGLGQIMPANIAPWARRHGMVPNDMSDQAIRDLYRSDPQFQERLARAQFGEYVERYGLRDALSRWHSGVSFEDAVRQRRHDGNMSTRDYVLTLERQIMQRIAQAEAVQQREYEAWAAENFGTSVQREVASNPFTPPSVRQQMAADAVNEANASERRLQERLNDRALQIEAAPPILFDQAVERGAAWLDMTPDQRAEVLQAEGTVQAIEDVLDFVQGTTAAGRAATRLDEGQAAAMQSRFMTTVLPFMDEILGTNAANSRDRRLIESIAGDPFSIMQLTAREQARVGEILMLARTRLSMLNEAYGLQSVARTRSAPPEGAVPGLPPPVNASPSNPWGFPKAD